MNFEIGTSLQKSNFMRQVSMALDLLATYYSLTPEEQQEFLDHVHVLEGKAAQREITRKQQAEARR